MWWRRLKNLSLATLPSSTLLQIGKHVVRLKYVLYYGTSGRRAIIFLFSSVQRNVHNAVLFLLLGTPKIWKDWVERLLWLQRIGFRRLCKNIAKVFDKITWSKRFKNPLGKSEVPYWRGRWCVWWYDQVTLLAVRPNTRRFSATKVTDRQQKSLEAVPFRLIRASGSVSVQRQILWILPHFVS